MPIARRAVPSACRARSARADDRLLVLRDLIARRQVGIEVVLAVEHASEVDLGVEAEPGPDRLLDAMPVDHRQHAGKRRVDGRDLRVRLGPELGRGAGEQLRAPSPGRALRGRSRPPTRRSRLRSSSLVPRAIGRLVRERRGALERLGRRAAPSPRRRRGRSPAGRAAGRRRRGRPAPTCAGRPARLAGTVNTSFRYIAIGSSRLLADREGGAGRGRRQDAVDLSRRPRRNRARSGVRTFCAFR